MPDAPFISYAQNGEDVVLWRALHSVVDGRYVEVGANDPTKFSISRSFYDRGWSGITIEPVPSFAALHREARPRDIQVEAAATSMPVDEITLHAIPETGLSTLVDDISERHGAAGFEHADIVVAARRLDSILEENHYEDVEIHFLVVDVEGAEADALRSIDLTRWRPWVLVIESTAPLTTEQSHTEWEDSVLAAGYVYCLFDGISRFYVAAEHADELGSKLSYPACVLDPYTRISDLEGAEHTARTIADKDDQIAVLTRQVLHWRSHALRNWASSNTQIDRPAELESHYRAEMAAMENTLSWRVTRPLRGARRLGNAIRRRG